MKLRYATIILTVLLWGTTACGVLSLNLETPEVTEIADDGNVSSTKNTPLVKNTPVPSIEPTPTVVEEPEYSFEPVTYHDEESGFEVLYPAEWTTPGGEVLGSRGYGISFLEQGEIQMQVTIFLWDPKRDLAAWSEHIEQSWTGSGNEITSKGEKILQGGHQAFAYLIQTMAGKDVFSLLTTIGDRYLQLSGEADPELLAEVASTLRIPEFEPPAPIVDDLNCTTVTEDNPLFWVACNIRDGIVSRNTQALGSWMKDPFIIGYWQSEWTERSVQEALLEISQSRLPADSSSPMAFTIDREQFPSLYGIPPENMLSPEINLAMVVYSEGWGQDGQGVALLFIAEDEAGENYWYALLVAGGHFDK